ncbi:MAG: IS4 family transposase, partial [Leptospirales bacterium]
LVIGWRIMLMTLLGREQPDLPAGELFTIIELTVLQTFAKRNKLKPPETIGEAVRLVGRLGGHLGRKNDPPPGHMAIWSGYGRLQDLCLGFELNSG